MMTSALTLTPLFSGALERSSEIFRAAPPADEGPLRLIASYDTAAVLASFGHSGLSRSAMTSVLRGTAHTAFLDDDRLAERVVSIFETQSEILSRPREAEARRQRLGRLLREFLSSGRTFDADALLSLISAWRTREAASLIQEHGRKFKIQVVEGNLFDDVVGRWGQVPNCRISFYQETSTDLPNILIRAMPPVDLASPDGWRAALGEVMERLLGAFHEAEHARHFNGPDAIRLGIFDRTPRLVSETLSLLEEHRQRLHILDFGISQAARERGMPVALYLKNQAYEDNYGWRLSEKIRRLVVRTAQLLHALRH